MRFVLAVLLPMATGCFVLGLVLPLMKMERLYFLEDKPSLVEIVSGLWADGDAILAAAVAVFSILFPALKLLGLHLAALGTSARVPLSMFAALGKWSMMDVMLVALVIFAAKTSGLASATSLPGLWLYASATLLTAISAVIARRV
ncbi:paraquat-inducible protein A [Stappia sp. GBMRC 2046]|uniref:Paraquat-inducible protein A n=1 Tax=Stappia sediminis TaxID=2692190 RepID=A0A7X3S864_9HYPH|nr:paraquat-inducible protein A [Stappia sediminis]MXN65445.1 paraquat-inducible protein A [Stappia sediminis]